ncbi:MAG: hypothetical protein JSV38_05780 [Desulfobacterales bacterium]|nr:MAG: hypothetical protein JSV38_05780 [Desulfobacterales bacterium]
MDTLPETHCCISNIAYTSVAPFLDQLTHIFTSMDQAYQEAANYYHFLCTGCEDSCCFTRFYHYTLLEYFFILEGYQRLSHQQQVEIEQRAKEVCRKTGAADKNKAPMRLMCPLNADGWCLAYDFRPMICRLHGIPHELHRPDGSVMQGKGCDAFYRQCAQKAPFVFDRTPFYRNMANLEQELRTAVGITQKIKMSIAQMIVSYAESKAQGAEHME